MYTDLVHEYLRIRSKKQLLVQIGKSMSSFIKDWTQKEVDSLTASFKRYRIFVWLMKFILPISAGAILLALMFFAQNEDKSAKITVENLAKNKLAHNEITSVGIMENPRFQGVDAENQPYSLMAKQAWQENKNEIQMRDITADITTADGNWISALAGECLYFMTESIANLQGGVEVFITGKDSSIVQIQTDNAKLDIKNSVISGDGAVNVKSDFADFSAKGFIAERTKQKITFTGPIKLVIVP